jgi:hypothetical protein
VSSVAVIVPLRPDALETARELVSAGPPFDLSGTPLEAHVVFLGDHEAIFVFEGKDVRSAVEQLLGEATVWAAATEWRRCLDGRPRVAEVAYDWRREQPSPLHVPGF